MQSDEREETDEANRIQSLEQELKDVWIYMLVLSAMGLLQNPHGYYYYILWLGIMGKLFMKRMARTNARRRTRIEQNINE